MTALYAARNTSHSSGSSRSNVPTVSVSQRLPAGIATPSVQSVTFFIPVSASQPSVASGASSGVVASTTLFRRFSLNWPGLRLRPFLGGFSKA